MKKQDNNTQSNENLLSFIDADNRRSNVLLTVKDGNLYDSQGNNYTQSYLDEEHIPVILGKAPRNSSSYFDRFGALNFFNAAAAPITNFTPSNIVGSIRKAHDYTSFMDSFMNMNNNGFFTDEYAQEHPYISTFGNLVGDIVIGGKSVRNPFNSSTYRKLNYKVNKLEKRLGLIKRNHLEQNFLNSNYRNAVWEKEFNKNRSIYEHYGNVYSDDDIKDLYNYFKDYGFKIPNSYNTKEGIKSIVPKSREYYLFADNPEYYQFIQETKLPPLEQDTIDKFLKRQRTSIRGVYAKNENDARKFITETNLNRNLSGGDRLKTKGGLYTSNSTGIAEVFKNPIDGKEDGYIGRVMLKDDIDKTLSIEQKLAQMRNKIYLTHNSRIGNGKHGTNYLFDANMLKKSIDDGAIAYEANYGRSNGDILNVTERAYLPSTENGGINQPVTLEKLSYYPNQSNMSGRWNTSGVNYVPEDSELFISKQVNSTTDFIKYMREALRKDYILDVTAKNKFKNNLTKLNIRQSNKAMELYTRANNAYRKNQDRLVTLINASKVAGISSPGIALGGYFIYDTLENKKRREEFIFKKLSDPNYKSVLSSETIKEHEEELKNKNPEKYNELLEFRKQNNIKGDGGYLNNNWTMQDEAGYRYWRSRLPKNLRDTDNNIYDMRAAYKAGMQPKWDEDDKLYHLDSRDPQSGRILKSPHHPTYLKALIEDGTMGYYPTMDNKGNTYTETWKGNNIFADGGYIPSDSIKKRIANWEGASMKTNRSFEAEARDFNSYLPKGATNKLSQQQLDALYSYSYNVGAGNFNKRVVPVLNNYLNGNATREDVQRSMYATRDNELRGLTTRRNAEREMFGGNYRTVFTGTGNPNYYGYIDRNQQYKNMVENQNKNKFQLPYNEQSNTYKNPFDEPNLNVSLQDVNNTIDNSIQQQYNQLPISKLNVATILQQANSPIINNNVQPDYSYAQSLLNEFDSALNNNSYAWGGEIISSIANKIFNVFTNSSNNINNKPVFYKSLSGSHFNTKKQAMQDNYDLFNKKGKYAEKNIMYTVKNGDNLWNIAKQNNIDLNTIYDYNPNLKTKSFIHKGDNIIIGKQNGLKAYNVRKQWEKESKINDNLQAIQSVKHNNNYIVIDKNNKQLNVFDKDNNLIYKTNDISTGASGNDYNTITYVDEKGKIINGKGNNSTPAGITKITGTGIYHGFPSFTRGRTNDGKNYEDIASSLHFGNTSKQRLSNGCVRIGGNTLNTLSKYINVGTDVYTLPEKGGSKFVVKDNKLSFTADNPYGKDKGKDKYWDDYNVYTDKTYSPLRIVSKNNGDSIFKENERKFINVLQNEKQRIMVKYNIDSDTYNHLAELALGIAQQETKYGTSDRYKLKNITPDLLLNVVRNNSNRSRGITQIKLKGDNKELQEIYKNLNINNETIKDSSISALATIHRLASIYKNEVRGHKFNNVTNYEALLYKWMGKNKELKNNTATPNKNTYINNVKKYSNNYDMYSLHE